MDVDVEAMLEAPYKNSEPESMTAQGEQQEVDAHGEKRSEHHRHSSRSRSRHRSSHHRSGSRRRSHSRYSSRSRRYHRSRSPRSSRERRHSSRRSPSREYSSRRRSRSRRRYSSRSPTRRSRRSTRTPSPHHRRHDRYDRDRKDRRDRGRSPSPPVPEEERDRRTVFVTQLAARLTQRELEDFFSQAGKVREATIIMDRNSRKSKGVGYVEYYEESSVQNALNLSGQKLLGIPVQVQLSEAEKNRLALQAQRNAVGQPTEPTYQRLYVGSLHFSLTDEDVRQIFEPFGPLDFVNLHRDSETGRSKGFGFIQYKNPADAKQALEKMNGFELAGRPLKVGLVTEKHPVSNNTSYNLDDEEAEGVALNSLSRAELMAKLAARDHTNGASQIAKPAAAPVMPAKPIIPTAATRYIMLNNMFNPAEETEPDWVTDLETDIKLECEKYGKVEHIKVNADSMGEVFLKFDNIGSAEQAIKALNGRWFGGKQITAACVSEAIFNANAV